MTKRKQDIVQAATLLFAHLYDLPETTTTQFEKIENPIALHFDIVKIKSALIRVICGQLLFD